MFLKNFPGSSAEEHGKSGSKRTSQKVTIIQEKDNGDLNQDGGGLGVVTGYTLSKRIY